MFRSVSLVFHYLCTQNNFWAPLPQQKYIEKHQWMNVFQLSIPETKKKVKEEIKITCSTKDNNIERLIV